MVAHLRNSELTRIRAGVREGWLTPEEGEDCLFLRRKFSGRYSLPQIIERRGYLPRAEIKRRFGETALGPVESAAGRSEEPTRVVVLPQLSGAVPALDAFSARASDTIIDRDVIRQVRERFAEEQIRMGGTVAIPRTSIAPSSTAIIPRRARSTRHEPPLDLPGRTFTYCAFAAFVLAALFGLSPRALRIVDPELSATGAALGLLGLASSLGLIAALNLVRLGRLPLPRSLAWVVKADTIATCIGTIGIFIGSGFGRPSGLSLMLFALGTSIAASALYGWSLRQSSIESFDGRVLAALNHGTVRRWQRTHVILLAIASSLALAWWSLLAYFGSVQPDVM